MLEAAVRRNAKYCVCVAYNFSPVDRELLLMPPSVAEWLPEDRLAWFVIDFRR